VLEVKWRSGHQGPLGRGVGHAGVEEVAAPMSGAERGATWWHQEAAGGGAMRDYCCYGAMVSRWYIGEPAVAALGMRANLDSQWGDTDDNAAMLVRYPNAMALLEGSWTTHHHGVATGPIVYGTTGTLVVDLQDGEPVVRLERGRDDTTVYRAEPLPEGRAMIAEEYIHRGTAPDAADGEQLGVHGDPRCGNTLDANRAARDSRQCCVVSRLSLVGRVYAHECLQGGSRGALMMI
jgi:predicted dehydrogenase